jgi:hypothetical protein
MCNANYISRTRSTFILNTEKNSLQFELHYLLIDRQAPEASNERQFIITYRNMEFTSVHNDDLADDLNEDDAQPTSPV